ncbi:hypothetical protein M9H77_36264 [Catharanthus roseus]|uniref:Uncharacterized protein n=1 Tax=Catharanthus roseus TaxID=4058 RepID=A0ACB9ZSB4_CATRO|nr:hypothetical protein M9H77_36264 [Catharanthus roseus]
MIQLHNFFFFITFMVVPCGMVALVLLKWFINRDVPTGRLLLMEIYTLHGRSKNLSKTKARNALFHFVTILYFLLPESKVDLSYFESFCGVLCLVFFRTFFFLAFDRSAKRERTERRKGQINQNEQ